MSVTFDDPAPRRSDEVLLAFMLNTGFSVMSCCQEEAYFVHPHTGYHKTAREAMESAMEVFERRTGDRWRQGWRPTSEW